MHNGANNLQRERADNYTCPKMGDGVRGQACEVHQSQDQLGKPLC